MSIGDGFSPRRARGGAWRPLIALTVVVVLLAAWLGARLGTEEAGRFRPSTSGLTRLWAQAGTQSAYFYGIGVHGAMATFASTSGVAAYDVRSGGAAWTWSPPPGEGVCAAAAGDGTVLVAYARLPLLPGFRCSTVAALDQTDGTVVWSLPMPAANDLMYLAVGDGQALVEFDHNSGESDAFVLDDYNLATGAAGWSDPLSSGAAAACTPTQPMVEGDVISVFDACPVLTNVLAGSATVVSFAAGSGKQLSGVRLAPKPCGTGGFVGSGSGYLVSGCAGALGFGLFSLDFLDTATGSQHSVEVDTEYFTRTVVSGDTAYLTLETSRNSSGTRSSGSAGNSADTLATAAAYDLSTGRELWQRSVPGYQVTMISADSAGALAAVYNGATLSLVRYARSDGTPAAGPGTALGGSDDAELAALAGNGDLDLQMDGGVLLAGGARNSSADFQTETGPGLVALNVGS